MKFDCLSLGDHLPDPRTKRYSDTQAERHRMWVSLGIRAEELGFSVGSITAATIFSHRHSSYYRRSLFRPIAYG
jgi:hypothetical protein